MTDDLVEVLLVGLGQTVYMSVATAVIAVLMGFPLGTIMAITDNGNIWPHGKLNRLLGTIINTVRSVPEIILIVVLIPFTRFVMGTSLGTTATIVPLSIGAAPYLARIFENSMREVERGKIEAALSMGASQFQIVSKVIIPEALPSLIRGLTLGMISIIGLTAVAGATGAGGLGNLAIRFGYQRYRTDILLSTVVIIILLVQGVQFGGDSLARHINRKRFKYE